MRNDFTSTLQLRFNHTERQRQRPMPVNGDAWESTPLPFHSQASQCIPMEAASDARYVLG